MAKQGPLAEALGAPDDLAISATVRARVEGIDGQFRPSPASADAMFSLRTTVAVEYDAGPVRFGGELWDARAYGEGPNSSITTSDVNTVELVQAYAKIELGDWRKGAKGGKGLLTLGRQTMDIGSRRLVARAIRQQNRKFGAAEAAEIVRVGEGRACDPRQDLEHVVSHGMAEDRVDLLEAVDVEEEQGNVGVRRRRVGEEIAAAYVERPPGKCGRERVVRHEALQQDLELALRGHHARDGDGCESHHCNGNAYRQG